MVIRLGLLWPENTELLLCIHILEHHHNYYNGGGGAEQCKKKNRELYITFCELHLPSSKMSPRIKTISGLSSHRAVWKALSICHSLRVWTQVSVIGCCCLQITPAEPRAQTDGWRANIYENTCKWIITSSACQTSVLRRLRGGACPTAP